MPVEVRLRRKTRMPTVAAAVTSVALLVSVSGLAASAAPSDPLAPPPAPPAAPVAEERIAYAGTQHRSLGVVSGQGAGAVSAPFFPVGPDHYDDQASALGDTVTWVSRRDTTTGEVYLRRGDGPVTRLTTNTSAEEHPTVSPDGTRVAFDSGAGRGGTGHDIFVVGVD